MPTSFLSLVKRFAREERGASMVEYAVLVGLVTALIVAALGTMSDQILAIFTNIGTTLTGAATGT
jgi:pilus assembly protein Flp/PilA